MAGEAAGGLRGAGTELRQKLRTQRRLRLVTLMSLAFVVLLVLPAFFGVRAAMKDPVFSSLDALPVPGWAAGSADDRSSGNRFCLIDCTFRERTMQSEKPLKETTAAYTSALTSAGWKLWKVADCPETAVADTTYSCWTRDEFTLDLRVGLPECAVDRVAAEDPALAGSVSAAPTRDPAECVGATVSIKVQNAISDTRGQKPDPQQSPLVGETPDVEISDDPLLQLTPTAPTPKAS